MATRKSPASAEKKTTTRKAPTKKAAASSPIEQTASPATNSTPEKHTPTYHEIAQLAEHFWVERGRPYGSPDVDWLRAEATLHAA